jgi:hypothetical protein
MINCAAALALRAARAVTGACCTGPFRALHAAVAAEAGCSGLICTPAATPLFHRDESTDPRGLRTVPTLRLSRMLVELGLGSEICK